ncbi:MAG: B12-binding domain-containing radical SAM protein [Candidatus Helarchaeota archaeon]
MIVIIVDALGAERGYRRFTRDVIGAGPRRIAGILEHEGIDSKIMVADQFLRAPKARIQADHLFISAMTMDYPAVQKVLRRWNRFSLTTYESQNKKRTSIRIIGGPISAGFPQIAPRLNFDIGIIGEAEGTLSILIRRGILEEGFIPNSEVLRSVEGIIYRTRDGFKQNPLRPYLTSEELNSFHSSVKRITDYPFFRAARVYIECVRGCSNFNRPKIQLPDGRVCSRCGACTASSLPDRIHCPLEIPPGCGYCSVPALFGPPRSRTLKNILDEIHQLISLGVTRFNLGASDFLDYQRDALVAPQPLTDPRAPLPNYPALEKLLSELAELKDKHNIYLFIENIKASLFTEEAAALIATYLPDTIISIGAETRSKVHARLLGRSSTPADVLKAVKIAHRYQIRVHTYFIHGLPGQTLQTAIETSRFMRKLAQIGIEKITVYKFKNLPKTAFENFHAPISLSWKKASKLIVQTAIDINRSKKMELLGKEELVIISERARGSSRNAIGYPLRGGPTVLVENAAHLLNQIIIKWCKGILFPLSLLNRLMIRKVNF